MRCLCIVSALAWLSVASGVSSGDVVISEVCYDAEGPDTGKEWIELWNRGPVLADLSGYCLSGASSSFIFPSFRLDPADAVVVWWNRAGASSHTDLFAPGVANLGNSSDYVALFDKAGADRSIVDYLRYYNGAAGQVTTWEQAASERGLWTRGDYIRTVEPGHSIALRPGAVGNVSADYFDEVSPMPGRGPLVSPEPVPLALFPLGLSAFLRKLAAARKPGKAR